MGHPIVPLAAEATQGGEAGLTISLAATHPVQEGQLVRPRVLSRKGQWTFFRHEFGEDGLVFVARTVYLSINLSIYLDRYFLLSSACSPVGSRTAALSPQLKLFPNLF